MIATKALFKFEIAARRPVHYQSVVNMFDGNRCQMWQCRYLRVIDVLQQSAGSSDTKRKINCPKTVEIPGLKL